MQVNKIQDQKGEEQMNEVNIEHAPPAAVEYLALRQIAGLSPMSREGAEIGLPRSLFAVCLREADVLIGMGRVIGDGGCFFKWSILQCILIFRGRAMGN